VNVDPVTVKYTPEANDSSKLTTPALWAGASHRINEELTITGFTVSLSISQETELSKLAPYT
jgi:hypothetical protein